MMLLRNMKTMLAMLQAYECVLLNFNASRDSDAPVQGAGGRARATRGCRVADKQTTPRRRWQLHTTEQRACHQRRKAPLPDAGCSCRPAAATAGVACGRGGSHSQVRRSAAPQQCPRAGRVYTSEGQPQTATGPSGRRYRWPARPH